MKSALLLSAALVLAAAQASAGTIVPVAPFNSIELEGGGHIVLRHGAAQQVSLEKGSTQYTQFHIEDGNKLVIQACNESCPHEYDLEIAITTPDIQGVGVSGGGAIESNGTFPDQHSISAAVQGGGRIDVRSMDVANANAAVNGGGHIMVKVERDLTAAINGGGQINYWGNPQVRSAVSGGGEINKGS